MGIRTWWNRLTGTKRKDSYALIQLPPKLEKPSVRQGDTETDRQSDPLYAAAQQTFNWEVRRNEKGEPVMYRLPRGDGGGAIEFAGINDKYHPIAVATLLKLKTPHERESFAVGYIADYVRPTVSKFPTALQSFAVDLVFNRGAAGAVRLFQKALNRMVDFNLLKEDGILGANTLAAMSTQDPDKLMWRVSEEQKRFELELLEKNPERRKFIAGLENRILKRYRANVKIA